MTLILSSPAFTPSGVIPAEFTCEGQDRSPPLVWQGIPEGIRSLALIIDDPDAPDPAAPKMTWVHWVLFNLPPTTTELPAGTTAKDFPQAPRKASTTLSAPATAAPAPPLVAIAISISSMPWIQCLRG